MRSPVARRHGLLLGLLATALAGCGSLAKVNAPLPTPVAPAAVTLPPGALYADDFSAPASGWPVTQGDGYTTGYTTAPGGPAYQIRTSASTVVLAPAPVASLPAAVRVDVVVSETGSGRDSRLGVECRYADAEYLLQVGADGYFAILQLHGGSLAADLADSLGRGPSAAVKDPPAANRLSVSCLPRPGGIALGLSVSGVSVAQIVATRSAAPARVEVLLRDEPGSLASVALFSRVVVYPG
jgi:hypothetical protein